MDANIDLELKDSLGRIQYEDVEEKDNVNRRNYKKSDCRDVKDGDFNSTTYYNDEEFANKDKRNQLMYEYTRTSLLNDNAKVVKGGSWKDPPYWLAPSTRRFMDEVQSTAWIGSRCAMGRVGSPVGLGKGKSRKNNIKGVSKKKKKKGRKLYGKWPFTYKKEDHIIVRILLSSFILL